MHEPNKVNVKKSHPYNMWQRARRFICTGMLEGGTLAEMVSRKPKEEGVAVCYAHWCNHGVGSLRGIAHPIRTVTPGWMTAMVPILGV